MRLGRGRAITVLLSNKSVCVCNDYPLSAGVSVSLFQLFRQPLQPFLVLLELLVLPKLLKLLCFFGSSYLSLQLQVLFEFLWLPVFLELLILPKLRELLCFFGSLYLSLQLQVFLEFLHLLVRLESTGMGKSSLKVVKDDSLRLLEGGQG